MVPSDICSTVGKVKTIVCEICGLIDTANNFQSQIDCVRKMPVQSNVMKTSREWQSKLIARIEIEYSSILDQTSSKASELKDIADKLTLYSVELVKTESTVSSSHQRDLGTLVTFLLKECQLLSKLGLDYTPRPSSSYSLSFDVKCAIDRLLSDFAVIGAG
ncbi:hypothetical protein AB6A40_001644 [Gnathostoma spinigerum]|uniref:Uncharacterized protein n=1 Tax=Gnathostoma spinigerum TaxID=75299 RepID=A0ABD6E5N2_9BILA